MNIASPLWYLWQLAKINHSKFTWASESGLASFLCEIMYSSIYSNSDLIYSYVAW